MTLRLKVTEKETSPIPRAILRTNGSTGAKSWTSLPTLYSRDNTESMMRGSDLQNFYKRKKRGDLLPYTGFFQYFAWTERNSYANTWTQHTGTKDIYDVVKGSGSVSPQGKYEINEFNQLTGLDLLSNVDAGPYLQDAAKAINGKGFDSLTFLAELAKVRVMFKNICFRLLKLAQNPRNIDHVASLWLEGRYGWRTLRFDLIDLNDALRNFDSTRRRYTETRGTTYTESWPTEENGTTNAGTYTTYRQLDVEIGVRGTVCADIQPAFMRFNSITTGWELIPFSFVIDWFVSIGSMLESIVFLASVTNYTAGTGTRVFARRTASVGNLTLGSTISQWAFTREEEERGEWVYRHPGGVQMNPTVKVKLDEWKVLDLLALIRQTFFDGSRRRRSKFWTT